MGVVLGRWFGSETSWLKSLFVTLITLLAVLLVICLFYRIFVFCITQYITRPPSKLMIAKVLEEIDHIHNIE